MNQNNVSRLTFAALAAATFAVVPSLRASESDDRIESSFQDSYVYRTHLEDDSVSLDAKDGVATLTGTVSAESKKSLAEDTVENLPGVLSVYNELKTEEEADTENADAWIGRKVKLALMYHRNVSGIDTDVAVKDGVVTLAGDVSSLARKELATEYAKDIDGVVSVVNNQVVREDAPEEAPRTEGEKIDDASVTAQVLSSMSIHRSTSKIPMEIRTRDGKVTITGIAKNDAEKALVTKMTSDIKGVDSVNNEMTIAAVNSR